MKKSELIAAVAEKSGLSKKDVSAVIDATINTMQEALKEGKKIRWKDGVDAILTLLKWRFKNF